MFVTQLILVILFSSSPIEQQIFGKTGRGLGFITEFSLIVVMLIAALCANYSKINFFVQGLVFASLVTSIYSIMQSFGIDFVQWYTRTNGIIGTLGNPNFQSTFAALALTPSVVYLIAGKRIFRLMYLTCVIIFSYTIYICQSTQGYIIAILSASVALLLFLWYKNKGVFLVSLLAVSITGLMATVGMLNKGPFATLLYKYSVRSRGEFFRTAFSGAIDNPFFGVGLDSFGDYSTFYKSAKDAAGVNEFTDNAHNYFLNYSVNGGFPLAIMYLSILVLSFYSFVIIQRRIGKFDTSLTLVFIIWIGFNAQSIISPASIALLFWGALLNGILIGLAAKDKLLENIEILNAQGLFKSFGSFLVFIAILISYPYFNVDRIQLKSLKTKDGLLAVESARSFPESSLRYQRIGISLLESNLPVQALEVARFATRFNPHAISSWGLVLANSTATLEERENALNQMLKLDPYSEDLKKIKANFMAIKKQNEKD